MNLRPGRLLGGGVNTIAHTLAVADFRAPLLTSIVPTRGTGAPTFTRATTAYVSDYEGVMRQVLSGEARFSGARRVRNLLLLTESLTTAATWTKINGGAGSAPVVTSGFTDPDGGATAFRIQANAGGAGAGDYSIVRQSMGGGNLRSIYVKSNTLVSQEIYFGAPTPGHKVTATTTWQRVTAPLLYGNSNYDIGSFGTAGNATVNVDVLVWHPQLEDITGRTDQTTPSEYVSVGVVQRNKVLQSEDFGNAISWGVLNVTVTTDQIANPLTGAVTADKIAATVSGFVLLKQASVVTATTTSYVYSIYVKQGSGATDANVFALYSVTGAADLNVIAFNYSTGVVTQISGSGATATDVGNGWWRLQLPSSAVTVGHVLRVYAFFVGNTETAGEYAYGYGAQLEEGTVATSYQAVGGTYLYHGAGVDGVKDFDTTLTGAAIPSSTLLGYLAEGSRTNLFTYSSDWTNAAWVKLSMTTAKTSTGPDGVANSATRLTATGANATALQLLVAAASSRTWSVWIRRVTGTGTVKLFQGATKTADVSSSLNSVTYTRIEQNASVDISLLGAGVELGTSGDAIDVWVGQFETGTFASSPIPTTTAAVTRNADVLTYPDTGNISDTAGTSYVEFSAAGVSGLTQQVLARDTNGRFPYINTFTDRTQLYDGTTQSDATVGASFINNTQKSAQSWGGGTKSVSYAGTAVVTSAYDGTQGTGVIAIGCNNSGTEGLGGNIRNVCAWLRKLPDATLKVISK